MTTKDDTATAEETKVVDVPAESSDEAKDTSTVTETSSTETKESEASETKGEGDKDEGTSDESKAGDKSEADDDSAAKEQNRLGFQLRQIRGNDQYVKTLRTNAQDWVNEAGLTDEQSRLRKLEADAYIKDVEQARASLVLDNERVAGEIPLFDKNSKEFDEGFVKRAFERYARDQLNLDDEGQIVSYKIPLLDYMREEADGYYAGSKRKVVDNSKSQAEMDAATETPSSTSTEQAKPNAKSPFDEAFEAGFNSVK